MNVRNQAKGLGQIGQGGQVEPLEGRVLLADPWGAFPKLIRQDQAVSRYGSINGAGQSVAILDTGIDYMHPALGAGFGPGFKVVGGYDFADDDPDPMDADGHGTGVAGVIGAKTFSLNGSRYQGLAPGANLVALRIDNGEGGRAVYVERIERALQWIIENRTRFNITAVNMSLGYNAYTSAGTQPPYDDELRQLYEAGVFISSSSGNGGVSSPPSIEYPGADPHVFSIGSVKSNDVISTFTERSGDMDLLAPGENVPTSYYDPANRKHIYVAATGTSFAAPHAAAASVLMRHIDPSLSPLQVMNILKDTGARNKDGDNEAGATTGITFSRLDIHAALAATFDGIDDNFEQNDNTGQATGLDWSSNQIDLSGLELVTGDADYFRFSVSGNYRVTFNFSGGGSATTELLNSSGSRVATLSFGQPVQRDLQSGTYYLKLTTGSTLPGGYGFSMSREEIQPPPPPPPPTPPPPMGMFNGTWNDVAYDSGGNLHVAWYDPNLRALRYSRRLASGAWSGMKTVDAGSEFRHISLAVDKAGVASFAYYEAGNRDLRYARARGSSFSVTVVDAAGDVGENASLVVMPSGVVAIAYHRRTGGDLRLATLSRGMWDISTIEAFGTTGRGASLAYHPGTGKLAVTYHNQTKGVYMYAQQVKSGNAWAFTSIAKAGKGGATSLAFDKKRHPGFSFYDAGTQDLKFARIDGKRWTVSTIATRGDSGKYNATVFDGAGVPSVFYYDASARSLSRARIFKGRWTIQTLAGNGGDFVSAAVSGKGAMTYAYHSTDGRVRIV